MSSPPLLTSVDGHITPSDEAVLPLPDDGLLRGDGVFEVLRLYGGRPFDLTGHLERLERSAAVIDLDVDRVTLEAEIYALLARTGPVDALMRLVVSRGGRRLVSSEPLPVHTPSISLSTVIYSPTVILNGVKSLSYAANMQATRIARTTGAQEALLVTPEGMVLEAPTSTLFWVSEGRLRTTDPGHGVLASITAAVIIEALDVELGHFPLNDVTGASEAFLASTTREVQPVDSVDGQDIPIDPAPMTNHARAAFAEALKSLPA